MKININSQNTPFTVDMYQTFNGDDTVDYILDNENYEKEKSLTYDDYNWTYDTKVIHKGLAMASIEWILNNCDENIILNIKLDSIHSPRFYNFQTDSYNAIYELDEKRFTEYMTKHTENYNLWANNQSYHVPTLATDNDFTATDDMLTFYLQNEFNRNTITDDYLQDMFQASDELWHENTDYTPVKKSV